MNLLLSDRDLKRIAHGLKLYVLAACDTADKGGEDANDALNEATRATVLQGEFLLMSNAVESARLVPVEDNPPAIEGES